MPINTILFESHSGLRWLVILAAVLALGKFAVGWAQNGGMDKLAENLMLAFTIIVTLQWVIGLVYALYVWVTVQFQFIHVVHLLVMTAAVGLVHMARGRWAKVESEDASYRNGTLAILGTMAIIFVGVILLPGGIGRWAF